MSAATIDIQQPTSELIPDHALAPGDDDLFDHQDFVDRLVNVIEEASTVHVSANVALYGPWGAGKSGVSNLLKERLKARKDDRFQYAYFDAFKYARQPLLRSFISHLTEALLESKAAEEYRRRLYEETTEARLRLPRLAEETKQKLIRWSAGLLAGLLALIAAMLIVTTGRANDVVLDLVRGVLPTAVLVAVIGLAARYLTVSTTITVPQSEEEFERVFMQLLDQVGVDGNGDRRLVVFVDELDRCAPDEVAATLETLRTFLGVRGCIFVVAADQQVLEHALTEKVRQATPADPANPYYSAGNAYLDKIFQYQLAFPPLRVRRLTHFALRLLDGRGGTWEKVDKEDVVSILLPTHIHSPRRVKVLLNSFALTYGVAEARAKRGQLAANLPGRAAELAKLVCLRTEFPLFARDLNLDDRLTEAVIAAAESLEAKRDPRKATDFEPLAPEIRERAILYAEGRLPVAQLLTESTDEPVPRTPLLDSRGSGATDPNGVGEAEVAAEESNHPLRRVHALQLVRYLEKTREVPGPRNDLIHLESVGAIWGLDPQMAQRIERDALDNRSEEVVGTINELGDEPERARALEMLGQLARESVGADADNAMKALLHSVAEVKAPLEDIAPKLARDVDAYHRRRGLREKDLPGALSLALKGQQPAFTESLVSGEAALQNAEFRQAVLRSGDQLREHLDRLVMICSVASRTDAEGTAAALTQLEPNLAEVLLQRAGPDTVDAVIQVREAGEEQRTRAEAEIEEIASLVDQLADQERWRLAEFAILPLIKIPGDPATSRAFGLIERLGELETQQASEAVLDWAHGWELERTEVLLRALNPEVLADVEAIGGLLDALGRHVWTEIHGGADPIPDACFEQLVRLSHRGMRAEGDLTAAAITETLQRRIDSGAVAEDVQRRAHAAASMAEVGLVATKVVADAQLRAIAESAQSAVPVHEQPGILQVMEDWVVTALPQGSVEAIREAHQGLVSDDCWIEPPKLQTFRLYSASELTERGQEVSIPDAAEIEGLAAEHGADFADGAGAWVEHFADSPKEVFAISGPYLADPPPSFLKALQRYSASATQSERTDLLTTAVTRALELELDDMWLTDAGIAESDEPKMSSALIQLFSSATNNDDRRRVFEMWELARLSSSAPRRSLIREVFLPTAENGALAFDLAVRYLDLCADPPRDVKRDLIERLGQAAPDDQRRKRLRKKLESMGLIDKPRSWIRRALDF